MNEDDGTLSIPPFESINKQVEKVPLKRERPADEVENEDAPPRKKERIGKKD